MPSNFSQLDPTYSEPFFPSFSYRFASRSHARNINRNPIIQLQLTIDEHPVVRRNSLPFFHEYEVTSVHSRWKSSASEERKSLPSSSTRWWNQSMRAHSWSAVPVQSWLLVFLLPLLSGFSWPLRFRFLAPSPQSYEDLKVPITKPACSLDFVLPIVLMMLCLVPLLVSISYWWCSALCPCCSPSFWWCSALCFLLFQLVHFLMLKHMFHLVFVDSSIFVYLMHVLII